MDSAQDPYKKFGIILIVFLLILIPSEIALTRPNAIRNFQLSLKLATQEKPKVTVVSKQISQVVQKEATASADHPTLYYVDLLYDPALNKVTKKGSGKTTGDLEALDSKPSTSSATFNYKAEAISSQGELIYSGWGSLYKTVITIADGRYEFRVAVPYEAGEKLNIYLANNQKLWEEKIQ